MLSIYSSPKTAFSAIGRWTYELNQKITSYFPFDSANELRSWLLYWILEMVCFGQSYMVKNTSSWTKRKHHVKLLLRGKSRGNIAICAKSHQTINNEIDSDKSFSSEYFNQTTSLGHNIVYMENGGCVSGKVIEITQLFSLLLLYLISLTPTSIYYIVLIHCTIFY